ncbi:MAG TPA: hemerythrin domain-containing protein [Steroidobacteraceae bacterium]|jgi:hemerythrin-like domain-containing protein
MSNIIQILLEEHRNIDKLLLVLERELDVFDRSEEPDYEIFQAVIQYFQDYPENCHHPKEDMVFEKLKARDAAAADRIGDAEADHRVETLRLRRLVEAVEDILAGREFLRQTFHDVVHEFIAHQRQHMDKEERLLFPAAIKGLRPEDWADIDARLNDRKDPLFNGVIETKFQALQRTILRWEQETETSRVKPSRVQI